MFDLDLGALPAHSEWRSTAGSTAAYSTGNVQSRDDPLAGGVASLCAIGNQAEGHRMYVDYQITGMPAGVYS
jgi:hypothetical protein